jgi:hypothetical protein
MLFCCIIYRKHKLTKRKMKNIYSLSFKENRLVWLSPGPGENPRPREAAEDAEKLKQQEYRGLIKDILKNPHEKAIMIRAQRKGEEGLKNYIKEYMLKYDKCKKVMKESKSDSALALLQENTKPKEVYMKDGKEIDINKYTGAVINYLRSLGRAGRVKLAKEADAEAAAEASKTASVTLESSKSFEVKDFVSTISQKDLDKQKRITTGFYKHAGDAVIKVLTSPYIQNKPSAAEADKKMNAITIPAGARVSFSKTSTGHVDYTFEFNGPKAWVSVNTGSKRLNLFNKIMTAFKVPETEISRYKNEIQRLG